MSDSTPNRVDRLRLSIHPVHDGVFVGLVLLVVAMVGILTTHHRGASAYENQVHSHLLDIARAATSMIDVEQHQRLSSRDQEGSELDSPSIDPLFSLLESVPSVRHAYTMVMVDDRAYFVLDAPSPFDPNDDVAGVMEMYEDTDPEMLEALRTGRELVTKELYSDQWGTFMSAYVPLHNSAGEQVGILGIDMTAEQYLARLTEMRRAVLLSIAIAMALSMLGGVAAGYVRRRIQKDNEQREKLIAALRRREAELNKLSMVAAHTDNGVLIADVQGRIEWVNDGFTRITEYTIDEVIGKRPDEFLHGPETDQAAIAVLLDGLGKGEPRTAELVNYSKSGRQFWVRVELQPVRDDAGDIVNFMSIESDITERKRMEQALRQSEQHLRAVIDTSPTCVKVVAVDGTVLEMNSTGLDMVEAADASQVVGTCVFNLIDPAHREAYKEVHQRVCRGEKARLEYEIIGLKGARRWLTSYAAPLVDPESGETLHVAVTVDMTDRMRAEREVAQSRERFELMSKATQDVIWDYDVVGDALWWNENLHARFGYAPGEIETSFDWWADVVHPDDTDRVVQSVRRALAGNDNHWSAEYRLRRSNGSYASVLDRAHIIRDESGRAVRVVGAIADLTEQKRAAEEIAFQKLLLECQAEASPDGILVVDHDRRIISHNQRFAEMWGIVEEVQATDDDEQLIQSVLDKLVDPDGFIARTNELTRHSEIRAEDEIHLRDGRTFDRHSSPIRTADGVHYGRVWFFRDVTEQKRYEQELEQHKLVVENSNAVFFRWRNEDGWPVDLVSENVARFGYTAEELLSGDVEFATMVHPDDLDRVAREVKQYADQDADSFEQEYRLLCRDGSECWVYDRTVVERDTDGVITHFQGVIIDITERKNNEQRMRQLLQELEERIKENKTLIQALSVMHEGAGDVSKTVQQIADALPDGFQLPDATAARIHIGDDSYCSRGFRTTEQMLSSTFRCDNGTTGSVEIVVLDADRLRDSSTPFLAQEDQLVRTIAESLKSYLDRQHIENQLRQHKIVVENSNTVLFRWCVADGWPVDLVSENVSQFGYTAADLLDGTVSFVSIIHPDDRHRVEHEVLDALESGVNSFDQEYRIICRDGSPRWVYDRTTAERNDEGVITHIQGIVIDVTERIEAERRLRDSEERLRRIASQVPGALYQFRIAEDGARSFPYMSDGIVELSGISRDELDSDPSILMSSILPEDVESVEALIVESARTMQPWKCEFRIRHRDGSLRWIAGNSIPQKEQDGSILWHGLIIDITDSKEAEEKLHRLTAIIEATTDFVGMANAKGEPIYINPAGRRMLNIGLNDELAGTTISDLHASRSADLLENVALPAAISNGIWVGETAFLLDDGSEVPVSQLIIAHKDADDNVEYFSTVARDMSRQKRAEEDIRRSQQFLRSTLDALSAHIAILDSNGRIIEVNEAWRGFAIENDLDARHFGIGTNYIATCESATGPCAEEAADAAGGIRRILRGEIDHFELEYPCHGPDEQRWFALRTTHFETDDGRCAVIAHENITENKLATDELKRARDAADAANRAKSEFLANMSHEIRTPMTAMLGYADLLMDASLDEKERSGYLDVIHRNGNHLLGVINDILDISKIESGKMSVEHVPASPASILAETVSLMRLKAIEKSLSLDLEFATDIPESIDTDPVRLRQILLNLIGNAIKFTRTGSVQVVARYDNADDDAPTGVGWLSFEITDTGIGLNDEQVDKLFQPFAQADSSMTRRFGGTGLGLAISRRLARLLGGDIEITRTGSDGSTFTLRLPVKHNDSTQLIRPDNGSKNEAEPTDPHSMLLKLDCRILLAEDGVDNQRLLSFLLTKAGADVTIVGDGQAALDMALEARAAGEPFDLILMDMQMPVMDGYEATRRLREQGYDGLIVALTAHAMASDRDNCLDAGCDEYLTKPIDRRTLIESVHRFVSEFDETVHR